MKKESYLGKQIRAIRGERSQIEFAHILAISQATLARYERGNSVPKLLILQRIAAEGGIALDEMMNQGEAHHHHTKTAVKNFQQKLNRKEEKMLAAYRAIQKNDSRLASLLDKLLAKLKGLAEE